MGLQGRAGRLLPDRYAQLRSPAAARRHAGHGPRAAREAARPESCLHGLRRFGVLEVPAHRSVPVRRAQARDTASPARQCSTARRRATAGSRSGSRAPARRASSSAETPFLAATARSLEALRARLGARFPIMAGHYFAAAVPDVLEFVGPAARGLYVSDTDVTAPQLELTPAAKRFLRGLRRGRRPAASSSSPRRRLSSFSARSLAPTGRASRCSSSSRRAA